MNGVNARGIRNPGARVGRVNGEKTRVKAGTRSGGETRGSKGRENGRNSEPRNTGDGDE